MGIHWTAWVGVVGVLVAVIAIVVSNDKSRGRAPWVVRAIQVSAVAYGLLTLAYYLLENRLPGPAGLTIAALGCLSAIVLLTATIASLSGRRGTG
jgi:hypothetical protein